MDHQKNFPKAKIESNNQSDKKRNFHNIANIHNNGVLQPIFRSFNSWLEMELLTGNQFSSIVKLKLICYK